MYLKINSLKVPGFIILPLVLLMAGCQSLQETASPRQDGMLEMEALAADAVSKPRSQASKSRVALTDNQIQDIFKRAKSLVENYFDVTMPAVELSIVANSVIEQEVERETRALVLPQFDNKPYAELFLSNIMSDQAGTYAALYAHQGTRVLVNRPLLSTFLNSLDEHPGVDQQALTEQALIALLIHEAVHAADDQMHQIHDRRELNFRASFSQSAAYEGHAQLVTREICSEAGCIAGLQELDKFMFDAPEPTDPVARSMQAVSRNVLEYSYIEGERFLQIISERTDGKELIADVLRSPPADPVQILDPSNYPDTMRNERNRHMFSSLQKLDHPWNGTPWAVIETSPIKGLDMRNNQARREATIDGFTRLITAMIGAQVYDQSGDSMRPIEISLMQTDSKETAEALATTFYRQATSKPDNEKSNLAAAPAAGNRLDLTIGAEEQLWPMTVYLSNLKFKPVDNGEDNYATLIATSGNWIVQLAGTVDEGDTDMISFAEKLITKLRTDSKGATDSASLKKVGLKQRLSTLFGFKSD